MDVAAADLNARELLQRITRNVGAVVRGKPAALRYRFDPPGLSASERRPRGVQAQQWLHAHARLV